MSDPVWWERAAEPDQAGRDLSGSGRAGRIVSGPGPAGVQPELVAATKEAIRAEVSALIPAYTPDWTNPDPADAGVAMVRLFGTMAEPVRARLNRFPEKMLAELLALAGIGGRAATPAATLVRFTASHPDGASVLVPRGVRVSAPPAPGEQDQVFFETGDDLHAASATLAATVVADAGRLEPVTGAFAPFGNRPGPGAALWLGFDGGVVSAHPTISLGIVLAPRDGEGGNAALRWDLLSGDRIVPVQVERDGTDGLRSTGVVRLRLPRTWEPGRPPGSRPLPVLRWLRVMPAGGTPVATPQVTAVLLNAVTATAVRTVRGEVPQPVIGDPGGSSGGGAGGGRTRLRLSQVPIVTGSVRLTVRDDTAAGVFGTAEASRTGWTEVPSLADRGPADRVFTVDSASGVLTFGDGVRGARVPQGFRNVVADSYQVGGGAAGAVAAGAIRSLVTSLPFVTGVTNPFPAAGGADAEPASDVLRDGPALLRASGRAVAPDDYGLLARQTPGALVARAHGMPGVDPRRPGVPAPGVVGVLVVPLVPDTGEPPVPDRQTLGAVEAFLTARVAPAGVRVIAAAPRYQRVAVDATVVLDPGRDRAVLLAEAADLLFEHLHPVRGGADGAGRPFGGVLRYTALVRRLLAVPGIRAVPRLTLTVDGLLAARCTDVPLRPSALPWPSRPVLTPAEPGEVVR
ncbi:putative baseplate assembly protein [Actinoplanes rectilineatus]|uniref:putative baseplate assembly protein n=1 Tax=Actinoplanes rectilineatus TaxID=113571 RepID=UPI0005F2E00A|nr:putative baseplate assembly protein [Actinoplanes rectilineatus]